MASHYAFVQLATRLLTPLPRALKAVMHCYTKTMESGYFTLMLCHSKRIQPTCKFVQRVIYTASWWSLPKQEIDWSFPSDDSVSLYLGEKGFVVDNWFCFHVESQW